MPVTVRVPRGAVVWANRPARRKGPTPTFTFWDQAATGAYTPGTASATAALILLLTNVPAVPLRAMWFYSAPGSTTVPSHIGLTVGAAGTVTVQQPAGWSGGPGSGWIRAPFITPPVLSAGQQNGPFVYHSGGGGLWYGWTAGYWPQPSALTAGPLTIPAGATPSYYVLGTWPGTWTPAAAVNFWVDVEVQPAP